MASSAKRGTLRAFGVVAVKGSVGSTVELSIVAGLSGCRVSVRETGETLGNHGVDNCNHRSTVGQICLNFVGCRRHTVDVAI